MLYPLSYGGNVLQLLDFRIRSFRAGSNGRRNSAGSLENSPLFSTNNRSF
jgi:hypothetical protein